VPFCWKRNVLKVKGKGSANSICNVLDSKKERKGLGPTMFHLQGTNPPCSTDPRDPTPSKQLPPTEVTTTEISPETIIQPHPRTKYASDAENPDIG